MALPVDGSRCMAGLPRLCTACFSGSYPTGDITPGMLLQIEHERIAQAH